MPDYPTIESPANQRIKRVARLHQRRHRNEDGLFLIEGAAELRRARQRTDLTLSEVFAIDPIYFQGDAPAEFIVSEPAMERLAVRGSHAEVVAVASQFDVSLETLTAPSQLALVAEGIEKPGNLGTMLRTADATGAAVIVCDPTVDVFNPQVVRASLGCLFTVSLGSASFAQTRSWLAANSYQTIIATPEATSSFYDLDLTTPTAIVIGSEHDGVSEQWKTADSTLVSLPMQGAADSLNAATTAAVMLYESLRQRM